MSKLHFADLLRYGITSQMVQSAYRYRVANPDTAPPGGWNYVQPETGRVWEREASIDLLAQELRVLAGMPAPLAWPLSLRRGTWWR